MAEYFKVMRPALGQSGMFGPAHASGLASVEYEVGKLTVAPKWLAEKGYDVTVFRTLQDAANFVRESNMVIYTAAIMGPVKEPLPFAVSWDLMHGRIVGTARKWPKGTLMVKGIIPMREVPRHKWPAWKEG